MDDINKHMETRVYYGEYTLRHWINLLLTRSIVLPEYQRSFVWSEMDIKQLFQSLEVGQFIPPITIAHYNDGTDSQNLILDGQQRLTSILLAYLGYMPIKEMFCAQEGELASGDDSNEEVIDTSMEWTYKYLLDGSQKKNTLPLILSRLSSDEKYKKLELEFHNNKEEFYDNTFLGFSFIIPNSIDAKESQRYFSTLFRNMNYLGSKLSSLESRRSLYYMNADYKDYLDGKSEKGEDVLCGIQIMENMQPRKIDFVRYLAILSQYVGTQNIYKVLLGYSAYKSRESYYADYVAYIVGLKQEAREDKFDNFKIETILPNGCWKAQFIQVRAFLERNKKRINLDEKTKAFTSWIDADYWLFGLLYWVLFNRKYIVDEDALLNDVGNEIADKRTPKEGNDYSRNPNRLGNLRERIQRSIELYKLHVQ